MKPAPPGDAAVAAAAEAAASDVPHGIGVLVAQVAVGRCAVVDVSGPRYHTRIVGFHRHILDVHMVVQVYQQGVRMTQLSARAGETVFTEERVE